jgi:hypothetical protein
VEVIERDECEAGQMKAPGIIEEKSMAEVCNFNSPIASASMAMVNTRNVLTCL